MKALVTGSAGLVGRHMTKRLEADGWNVSTWDIVEGNDARTCFALDKNRYDLVVHAAYHVGGRAGIDGTNRNFPQNVQLDGAMFDWAVRTQQKRVLYFSSSAAYPVEYQTEAWARGIIAPGVRKTRPGDLRLEERDVDLESPGLPDAGYGWAKLTGEMMARDARKNGVGVTVVRPASGCAADQDDTYPWTAIAGRVLRKENPLVVWGPPGQTRDWIDMSDVVSGCLELALNDVQGPVNISSGRATTMGELAAMMWERAHGNLDGLNLQYDETKPTGVYYRVLDPSLFNQHYTPKKSLEVMVDEVVSALRGRATH